MAYITTAFGGTNESKTFWRKHRGDTHHLTKEREEGEGGLSIGFSQGEDDLSPSPVDHVSDSRTLELFYSTSDRLTPRRVLLSIGFSSVGKVSAEQTTESSDAHAEGVRWRAWRGRPRSMGGDPLDLEAVRAGLYLVFSVL